MQVRKKKKIRIEFVSELESFLLHKINPIKRKNTAPDTICLCPDITDSILQKAAHMLEASFSL